MKLVLLAIAVALPSLLDGRRRKNKNRGNGCDMWIKDKDTGEYSCESMPDDNEVVWNDDMDEVYEGYDGGSMPGQSRGNADGGSCAFTSKAQAYDSMASIMHDFKRSKRVKLNTKVLTMKLPVNFRWGHRGKTAYSHITIDDGYSGNVKFYAQDSNGRVLPQTMTVSPLDQANNGGFFFCQKSRDENLLDFEYGQPGFHPTAAVILTWLYLSNDEDGCPASVGNTFQLVIAMVNSKKRGKIIFNYGGINYQADGTTVKAGYSDFRGDEFYLDVADGTDEGTVDDIPGLAFTRHPFSRFYQKPTEIYNPPTEPDTCDVVEQCHCAPITSAPEITWQGVEFGVDIEFKGYCSETPGTLNYATHRARGHICFIKPISSSCNNDGSLNGFFASTFLPTGEGITEQPVLVREMICEVDSKSSLGMKDGPKWVRRVDSGERKLINDLNNDMFKSLGMSKLDEYKQRRQTKWVKRQIKKLEREMAEEMHARSEAMLETDVMKAAREHVTIACGFYCQHPDIWSDTPQNIYNDTNAKFTYNGDRNGVWKCWDQAGNQLADGAGIPHNGICKLTCPYESQDDAVQHIRCSDWNRKAGLRQYYRKNYNKLATQLGQANWNCVPDPE